MGRSGRGCVAPLTGKRAEHRNRSSRNPFEPSLTHPARIDPRACRAALPLRTAGWSMWPPRPSVSRQVHGGATALGPAGHGTFIDGGRSCRSRNRRGGDDGKRHVALVDRDPDPDHPADLAVWRTPRLKCASTVGSVAGSLWTVGTLFFIATVIALRAVRPRVGDGDCYARTTATGSEAGLTEGRSR